MEFKEYSKVKLIIISKHNKLKIITNLASPFNSQSQCSSESKEEPTWISILKVCSNIKIKWTHYLLNMRPFKNFINYFLSLNANI